MDIILVFIAVAVGFFLIVMAIDCHRFVIKEYTCSSME